MGVGAGACPPPIWGCSGQAVHLRVLPWEMVVSITTFLKKIIFLFLAALGIPCWVQAVSGCGEQGLLRLCLWASRCSGLPCFGVGAPGLEGLQEL